MVFLSTSSPTFFYNNCQLITKMKGKHLTYLCHLHRCKWHARHIPHSLMSSTNTLPPHAPSSTPQPLLACPSPLQLPVVVTWCIRWQRKMLYSVSVAASAGSAVAATSSHCLLPPLQRLYNALKQKKLKKSWNESECSFAAAAEPKINMQR